MASSSNWQDFPCLFLDKKPRPDGYVRLCIDGRHVYAHRYAYEQAKGPIPKGYTIDHLCRVRHCVQPEHLEPVTRGKNVLRGVSFSAQKARQVVCIRGHELKVRSNGQRRCPICTADNQRRRRSA